MPVTAAGDATSYDVMQLNLAVKYLNQSTTAQYALAQNVEINVNTQGITSVAYGMVYWDPTQGLQVVAADGSYGVQSAAAGLIHELAHKIFGHDEARATEFESAVLRELGEPTRGTYDDSRDVVKVDNPTLHTEDGHWEQMEHDGSVTQGPAYSGSQTETVAPSIGGGGGGGGSGGGAGDAGGSGGDIYIPGYGDDGPPEDVSYPRQLSVPIDPIEVALVGAPEPDGYF